MGAQRPEGKMEATIKVGGLSWSGAVQREVMCKGKPGAAVGRAVDHGNWGVRGCLGELASGAS